MIRMLSLAVCCLGGHTATWAADSPLEWKSDDGTASFKVGGVIRVQQRYESGKKVKIEVLVKQILMYFV